MANMREKLKEIDYIVKDLTDEEINIFVDEIVGIMVTSRLKHPA